MLGIDLCRNTCSAFRAAASVGLCEALGWKISCEDGRILLTVPLRKSEDILRDAAGESAFVFALRGRLSRCLLSCLSEIADAG